MADLSPEGHRKRMKERYIKGSSDTLDDHHLLELLLFYSIPRKDVKPVAYNILNRYKTLDKVFSAEYEDLLSIDSVGESTAMLIKLINDINKRIDTDKTKYQAAFELYRGKGIRKQYFAQPADRAYNRHFA